MASARAKREIHETRAAVCVQLAFGSPRACIQARKRPNLQPRTLPLGCWISLVTTQAAFDLCIWRVALSVSVLVTREIVVSIVAVASRIIACPAKTIEIESKLDHFVYVLLEFWRITNVFSYCSSLDTRCCDIDGGGRRAMSIGRLRFRAN